MHTKLRVMVPSPVVSYTGIRKRHIIQVYAINLASDYYTFAELVLQNSLQFKRIYFPILMDEIILMKLLTVMYAKIDLTKNVVMTKVRININDVI